VNEEATLASWIEDYGMIGDLQTAALVGRDGSIDWLCLPRFDSGACFAALLGDRDDGHWTIAPANGGRASSRRYVGETLVLESTWDSTAGTVRVVDFMPHRHQAPDVVRIVEGVRGRVSMRSLLRLRFDYGRRIPWVRRSEDHQIVGLAGPDAVYLSADVETRGEDFSTVADFTVAEGDRVRFVLTWHPSQDPPPKPVDADQALAETLDEWEAWTSQCRRPPKYADAVGRSVVTLKALTYAPTGGIVAAATTSLPEDLGGVRNWDYRYCWLRDASLALEAMLAAGYTDEATEWRSWLLRAVAGSPRDMQIMYGVGGETRLLESTCDWLAGYEGSTPVRIGNAAATQSQLDIYGEVIDVLHQARVGGIHRDVESVGLQIAMADHLETVWDQPDESLWEVRGPRQQFTHSKVMCWVAFDRLARAAPHWGRPELQAHWRDMADLIRDRICRDGWNDERGAFTQAFGSDRLDASLLLLPRLGFLPADDPRIVSTVEAVQRELTHDGLVMRYQIADPGSTHDVDGLPGGEGSFIACSFWLADALHRIGRTDEARDLFERLLDLRNDLGLLAEEYDARVGRQVGNFPQAFSHIGLVSAAYALTAQSSAPAD
jgi:GH15 family glucan-1,4-alpha-glucosidase